MLELHLKNTRDLSTTSTLCDQYYDESTVRLHQCGEQTHSRLDKIQQHRKAAVYYAKLNKFDCLIKIVDETIYMLILISK